MKTTIFAYLPLCLLGLLTLNGCDYVNSAIPVNEPKIVIPAGFTVKIAGKKALIHGFDNCSGEQDNQTVKLSDIVASEDNNCVVIDKGRSSVPVMVYLPGGSIKERWTIVRVKSGSSMLTSMIRPDGTLVEPANYPAVYN
ncbi:hypothetical protein ACFH4J_003399 [Escherichia coli]